MVSRLPATLAKQSGIADGAAPAPAEASSPMPEGPDRLEEAEQAILQSIPHLGAAASVAEMYARRMRDFQRVGQDARAVAAFGLAAQWMWFYASQATSGGEGLALSRERDLFIDGLVRELGHDPRTRT